MANKEYLIDGVLPVTVYKRRTSRNLRLTVAANGKVRVTIPAWAPYRAGLEFAKSRHEWIKAQKRVENVLKEGQSVGKAHRLHFVSDPGANKVSTRISNNLVIVKYPSELQDNSTETQHAAGEAVIRALRQQAENLLPQRLRTLADLHGFEYASVSIKKLKGRWGSCDHQKNIVLNLFLMQLPWELIDYVLLHELTHTSVLKHGPTFWKAMEEVLPDVKSLRKQLRQHQPVPSGSPLAHVA